jgi:parvulin-like peptidyl-prolyl isomerase
MDKDFNQVEVSRINKISDLLKSSGGLEQFGKYADEYNDGAYYGDEGAVEKFGPAAVRLAVGQVSDIIPRANGYYIIKRIDDKNGQIGIKYLFVRAQTPDQYINKKLEKAKAFILVN